MPDWAQRVYAQDKQSAEICRGLQQVGFRFDSDRKARIGAQLREAEAQARSDAEAILTDAIGQQRRLIATKSGGISTKDLAVAFFEDLQAPVLWRSADTGGPSLDKETLNAYVQRGGQLAKFSLKILEFRRFQKLRSTYIDGVVAQEDGRVRPSWYNYGTVSGRYSCQDPPLQTLPDAKKGRDPTEGIRGLFIPSSGRVLVSFDAGQFEMRVAAAASGDQTMLRNCEAADIHAANAAMIWPSYWSEPPAVRKYLRALAKNFGFAIAYLAGEETVYARILAEGQEASRREISKAIKGLKRNLKTYYEWQAGRFLRAQALGWTDTPILGRRRFFGLEPQAPEVANFPIQGGAADVMNSKLPEILRRIRASALTCDFVAQVHDSCVFDVAISDAGAVEQICRDVFSEPVVFSSSGAPISVIFPIELNREDRWS